MANNFNKKTTIKERMNENKKIEEKRDKLLQNIGLIFSIVFVVFAGYVVGEKLGNHLIEQKNIRNEQNIEENSNYKKVDLNLNFDLNDETENDISSTIILENEETNDEIVDELEESIIIN